MIVFGIWTVFLMRVFAEDANETEIEENSETLTGMDLMIPKEYYDSMLQTIPCIREYFKIYFNFGSSVGGSIVTVSVSVNDPVLQEVLLMALHNDRAHKWTIMTKNPKQENEITYDSEEKAKNYLMIIESVDDVTDIISQWKAASTWNPLAQVLCLFAHEMTPSILDENTAMVLTLLLESNILNVNVMSKKYGIGTVQVSTIFPYENENCADMVSHVRIVDHCEYDEIEDIALDDDNIITLVGISNKVDEKFPNNLHECPLKVSARVYEPYAMKDLEKDTELGIDVMLVKTVADQLNMSILLEFPNQTLFYVYQDLIENEINLIIGGVDEDPGISELLSSTIPYYQDDLTWCVAKAGQLAQWTNIFTLFKLSSWAVIGGTVLASSVVLFIISRAKDSAVTYPLILIETLAITLSHSIEMRQRSTAPRIFLLCFILFALIFNAVYQTFLISILTQPRLEKQISTIQQIFENNMDITGGVEVIRHITKNDTLSAYLRKKMIICYDIEKCLQTLENNKLLAVAISREHILNNPRIRKDKIFCFPRTENIYSYLVSILATKNYHLLEKLNKFIRYITESGLIMKWKNDLNFAVILKEEYEKIRIVPEMALNLKHMYGAFLLLCGMTVVSITAFILEMIVYVLTTKSPCRKLRNTIRRIRKRPIPNQTDASYQPGCNYLE